MRRGWMAVVLLGAMLALAGWHLATLDALTGELEQRLERAEVLAERGDWGEADRLTREARETWSAKDRYLHMTLDHEAVDQIDVSFAETLEFIQCREAGEYSAANAKLRTQLELLGEMERPVPENLL